MPFLHFAKLFVRAKQVGFLTLEVPKKSPKTSKRRILCYVHLNSRTMGAGGPGGQIIIPMLLPAVVCQTPNLMCPLPKTPLPQDLWAPGPHSPRPQDSQHPKTTRHNTPGQDPKTWAPRPRKFWISSLGLPLELPLIPPNINFERVASISNLFKWMTL